MASPDHPLLARHPQPGHRQAWPRIRQGEAVGALHPRHRSRRHARGRGAASTPISPTGSAAAERPCGDDLRSGGGGRGGSHRTRYPPPRDLAKHDPREGPPTTPSRLPRSNRSMCRRRCASADVVGAPRRRPECVLRASKTADRLDAPVPRASAMSASNGRSRALETAVKGLLFDCRMCGQCVLLDRHVLPDELPERVAQRPVRRRARQRQLRGLSGYALRLGRRPTR